MVAITAAGSLAACGNSRPSVNREPHPGTATASTGAGGQQLTVTTGRDYRFHPSEIVVHPGPVTIHLVNNGNGDGTGAPHNWTLPIANAGTALVGPGQEGTVRFTAPAPGRYQFVCTIHVQQGQTGTLVVVPG
jgi:plastocyanin